MQDLLPLVEAPATRYSSVGGNPTQSDNVSIVCAGVESIGHCRTDSDRSRSIKNKHLRNTHRLGNRLPPGRTGHGQRGCRRIGQGWVAMNDGGLYEMIEGPSRARIQPLCLCPALAFAPWLHWSLASLPDRTPLLGHLVCVSSPIPDRPRPSL